MSLDRISEKIFFTIFCNYFSNNIFLVHIIYDITKFYMYYLPVVVIINLNLRNKYLQSDS